MFVFLLHFLTCATTHEFGHSLGLSHSSVVGALMFPWCQGIQNGFNYELPEDDKLGIQNLYESQTDQMWGHNSTYHSPLQTPPPTPPLPTLSPARTRPTRRTLIPNYPNYPQRPYDPDKPYTEKPMTSDVKYPYNPYDRNENYPPKPPPRTETPDDRYYPAKRPETTTYPNKHRQRYPVDNYQNYNPEESSVPKTCDTSYDAISVIRGEIFIFKDRYFWRIGDKGLAPGYPVYIHRLWKGLPKNLTHIDAVYERRDYKIVFFIGRNYYVHSGITMERDYPKPLTRLGLPASLNKIDAAMVWGHNGKTYFFSGDVFWRFDEDVENVELDYPRDISMWKGVGTNIDAVFQWKDGKLYFFKGKGFWKFDDLLMRVENEQQTPSAPFWMGCTTNLSVCC